jgi:hypothetical protein
MTNRLNGLNIVQMDEELSNWMNVPNLEPTVFGVFGVVTIFGVTGKVLCNSTRRKQAFYTEWIHITSR